MRCLPGAPPPGFEDLFSQFGFGGSGGGGRGGFGGFGGRGTRIEFEFELPHDHRPIVGIADIGFKDGFLVLNTQGPYDQSFDLGVDAGEEKFAEAVAADELARAVESARRPRLHRLAVGSGVFEIE